MEVLTIEKDIIKALDKAEIQGIKLGFQRIEKALRLLGHPEKELKIIHVAGTNGKGSTCTYIQSILYEAGYKTGLFTSPQLNCYEDYFKIDGKPIDEKKMKSYGQELLEYLQGETWDEDITKFELLTAMAYYTFYRENVEYAIIEVGLGGLEDSTNVIEKPLISVITAISMDHTGILGNSIEDIARHKAGIIKMGVPVVHKNQNQQIYDIIEKIAVDKESQVMEPDSRVMIVERRIAGTKIRVNYSDEWIEDIINPLAGDHQINNLELALHTVKVLSDMNEIKIKNESIKAGIASSYHPRRLEVVHREPTIIMDGAHNMDAVRALAEHVKNFYKRNQVTVLCGVFKDKAYKEMVEVLTEIADTVIMTEIHNHPRRLTIDEARINIYKVKESDKLIFIKEEEKALAHAKALVNNDEILVIAGSFYLFRDN